MGVLQKRGRVALFATLALVAAACGGSAKIPMGGSPTGGSPTGGGTERVVSVELKEFTLIADPSMVAAGSVTINAKNAGATVHAAVIKTDLAPGAIPLSEGKADETAAGVTVIGEIGEFAAGTSDSGTFTLTAGKYALICNIPGHYQSGMRAGLAVT